MEDCEKWLQIGRWVNVAAIIFKFLTLDHCDSLPRDAMDTAAGSLHIEFRPITPPMHLLRVSSVFLRHGTLVTGDRRPRALFTRQRLVFQSFYSRPIKTMRAMTSSFIRGRDPKPSFCLSFCAVLIDPKWLSKPSFPLTLSLFKR